MKRNFPNGFDSAGADLSPDDLRRFGFADSEDSWLHHLHEAFRPDELGSIGAYELIEEVSRGGQGVVWRARQPGLRRDIALKRLIAGGLASSSMRRRFEREVEAVSALHHPGIVTVYGMEEVDGVPLLAMEWVEGEPITDWARGRSREDVWSVFLRVCDAVQHAHQNGILHRDLKPSNVLVDEHDRPRVLDFGLAKSVDPSGDTLLTESGGFLGTPGYAAPEQIEGGRARPDVRSDVFALGVILYELVTGRRPYRPEDGIRAYLDALDREAIPRPSTVAPGLDGEVDAILLEALASDPTDRYPSVAALADDVRRYVAGEPVRAHPPTTWYELRKLVRRNRVVASLSGALFLTVVVFGVLTFRQAMVIASERDAEALARAVAEDAGARAAREAEKSHAVLSFLLEDMIEEAGPKLDGEELKVTDVLEHAVASVDDRFGGQPEAEALLYRTIAQVFMRMGRYSDARDLVRRAGAILATLPLTDPYELFVVELVRGRASAHMSEPDEAEEAYRAALAVAKSFEERDLKRELDASLGLADCLMMQLDWPAARQAYANCVAIGELDEGLWDSLAACLHGLAICEAQLGQRDEARDRFEQVVEIIRTKSGTHDIRYVDALSWLGDLDELDGDLEGAIDKWRFVLASHRKVYGREHPKVASSLGNLGDLLRAEGRLDEAFPLLEEAVDVSSAVRGPEHVTTLTHRVRLAEAQIASGDADEVVDPLEDIVAVFLGRGGEAFTWTRRSREVLARAQAALGDDAAAAVQWEALLFHQHYWTYESLCGHWDTALGVFTRLGRRDELLQLLDQTLVARRDSDEPDGRRADTLAWGGQWFRRIGEDELADRWE